MRPGIGQPDGIKPRRHHRRQPAISADSIDQIEDEHCPARAERIDAPEVWRERDDLGGIAKPRQRLRHSLGGDDGIDLVGAAVRRRMQHRDQARRRRQ